MRSAARSAIMIVGALVLPRTTFGITDGPAYQDIDNPNAALFHIKTDDMDRAMQWFKSDTFKNASQLAKVTGRAFYLAQPQT